MRERRVWAGLSRIAPIVVLATLLISACVAPPVRTFAGAPTRVLEEIQYGFERDEPRIRAVFNRYLWQKPNAEGGKIVVSVVIAPDGSVPDARIVSSTFADADLEQAILAAVRQVKFGARDVPVFTFPNYPLTFSAG